MTVRKWLKTSHVNEVSLMFETVSCQIIRASWYRPSLWRVCIIYCYLIRCIGRNIFRIRALVQLQNNCQEKVNFKLFCAAHATLWNLQHVFHYSIDNSIIRRNLRANQFRDNWPQGSGALRHPSPLGARCGSQTLRIPGHTVIVLARLRLLWSARMRESDPFIMTDSDRKGGKGANLEHPHEGKSRLNVCTTCKSISKQLGRPIWFYKSLQSYG